MLPNELKVGGRPRYRVTIINGFNTLLLKVSGVN